MMGLNKVLRQAAAREWVTGKFLPEFSKSYFVVRYNKKFQPFSTPKIVQHQVRIILPQKYKLVATLF